MKYLGLVETVPFIIQFILTSESIKSKHQTQNVLASVQEKLNNPPFLLT